MHFGHAAIDFSRLESSILHCLDSQAICFVHLLGAEQKTQA